MNGNSEKLQRAYNELIEYRLVLKKVRTGTRLYVHVFLEADKSCFIFILFQAGEFFNSAQKKATAKQREEEHRRVERSIDSPLLLEQVLICYLLLHVFMLLIFHLVIITYRVSILLWF